MSALVTASCYRSDSSLCNAGNMSATREMLAKVWCLSSVIMLLAFHSTTFTGGFRPGFFCQCKGRDKGRMQPSLTISRQRYTLAKSDRGRNLCRTSGSQTSLPYCFLSALNQTTADIYVHRTDNTIPITLSWLPARSWMSGRVHHLLAQVPARGVFHRHGGAFHHHARS